MITKNSVMKIQNPAVNHESWPVKSSRNYNFQSKFVNLLPLRYVCVKQKTKNIRRVKEWIFANVCWNFVGQTITFTKRSSYIMSLNKKINWLKSLLTSPLKAKKEASSVK